MAPKKTITLSETLVQDIANLMAQLPYGQVYALMNRLQAEVNPMVASAEEVQPQANAQ